MSTIKVCEHCKHVFHLPHNNCPECGRELTFPERTDAYLRSFLEVDEKLLARFKEIRAATIEEAKRMARSRPYISALGISGSARDEADLAAQDSNSEYLLLQALAELGRLGARTDIAPLRRYRIQPCKACYSTTNTHCHFSCSCYPRGTPRGDDMSDILYDKVLDADIILIATPVNNFKPSSLTTLFLDRCISLDGSLPPADPEFPKNRELNIKHTKFVELMADAAIPGSGFLRRFIGKVAGIIVTGHEEGASAVISTLFMTLNHFGMIFAPWNNMYAMSSITVPTYRDKPTVTSPAYVEEAVAIARNAMKTAQLVSKFDRMGWEYDYAAN